MGGNGELQRPRTITVCVTPFQSSQRRLYVGLQMNRDTNFDEDEDDNTDGVQHPSLQQRYPWTPTHSFFAAMGGFALDTRGEKANFLPCNRRRIALTSEGILYLLENKPSLIPDISESTIKDKSKGSWITKLITCLQATWFCAQCFARWSQGVSVSLLELNTLAHALCAFLIYFFWWNKPLDIDEPIIIHGESMHRVAAFMCLSAWSNRGIRYNGSYLPNLVKRHGTRREHEEEDRLPDNNGTLELRPGQSAYDFKYTGCISHEPCQCKITLSPADIRCWQLAREALDSDLVIDRDKMSLELDEGETYMFSRTGQLSLVGDRSTNDPATYNVLSQLSIGILLASLLYGGIHLVAWNRAFRTTAEAVLWKLSGLGIIAYGVVLSGFTYFDDRTHGKRSSQTEAIWSVIIDFVMTPGIVFYIFCRIYIIVESFLDLFYLPDSAFQVPSWSQYLPHI